MSSIRNTVLNAVVAVLPVAIVYFSGWAFLSSYLAEFGGSLGFQKACSFAEFSFGGLTRPS